MSNHYQRGQRKNCSFFVAATSQEPFREVYFPGKLLATADIEKLCFEMAVAKAE